MFDGDENVVLIFEKALRKCAAAVSADVFS